MIGVTTAIGGVVSTTVIVAWQLVELFEASLIVTVTTVDPIPTNEPGAGDCDRDSEPSAVQLSCATTSDRRSGTDAWQEALTEIVRLVGPLTIVGGVMSLTTNGTTQFDALPAPSVTVTVIG